MIRFNGEKYPVRHLRPENIKPLRMGLVKQLECFKVPEAEEKGEVMFAAIPQNGKFVQKGTAK